MSVPNRGDEDWPPAVDESIAVGFPADEFEGLGVPEPGTEPRVRVRTAATAGGLPSGATWGAAAATAVLAWLVAPAGAPGLVQLVALAAAAAVLVVSRELSLPAAGAVAVWLLVVIAASATWAVLPLTVAGAVPVALVVGRGVK